MSRGTMKKTIAVILALASLSLGGCAAVALTALGVGMATGVGHTLGGMVYKTFTAPQAQVKRATHGALQRMQVKVVKAQRSGPVETILAKVGRARSALRAVKDSSVPLH